MIMETKELKIQIPEGYEIDNEKSTFEKIIFKKKEICGPKNWEEYCCQQQTNARTGYFHDYTSCTICETSWACRHIEPSDWRNVLPSKELAEAFLAMMQLMSLRRAWIGDWKPNFNSCDNEKWCIEFEVDKARVVPSPFRHYALSFPTLEMAVEFKDCFKDLLETAKPLI